jgi:WD40 repeat protein
MVDANNDKTITWGEFADFLLLENQSLNNLQEGSRHHIIEEPKRPPPSAMLHAHKHTINRIIQVDQHLKAKSYLSSSADGVIKVWCSKALSHTASLCNTCFNMLPCSCRERVPVMDIAVIQGVPADTSRGVLSLPALIVAAGIDTSLNIYDAVRFQVVSRISNYSGGFTLQGRMPTTVSSYNHKYSRVLLWGDQMGFVTLWKLCREWHICDGSLPCHDYRSITNSTTPVSLHQHSDVVMAVRFYEDLNSIVSCSLDKTVKVGT